MIKFEGSENYPGPGKESLPTGREGVINMFNALIKTVFQKRTESKRFYLKEKPSKVSLFFSVLFLIFSLVVLFSTKIQTPNKQRPLVVQTGSMEPIIGVGSLIFPKTNDGIITPIDLTFPKYKIGDVIVFKKQQGNSLISHRVIGVKNEKDNVIYKTKGDANNTPDSFFVSEKNIIGRVGFYLPYIGYLINLFKLPYIYFSLIAIPGMYVLYKEIFFLIAEFSKNRSKRTYFRKEYFMPIVFLLFIGFFMTSSTKAMFTSSAQNINNTFSAGTWITTTPTLTPPLTLTPTPTTSPTHLIINEVFVDGNEKKEWVELYNSTPSSINVSGWKIEDNYSTDTFPTVSPIPANGYAVIIPHNSNVNGIPTEAITIELGDNYIGNGLADTGDRLTLKNASDATIDNMSYGTDTTIFNLAAPGNNKSLARNPNGTDTNTAGDWNRNATPSIGVSN